MESNASRGAAAALALLVCLSLQVPSFAADSPAASAPASAPAGASDLVEAVTVTGTREKKKLVETPASIGIVRAESLRLDRPTHPAQAMGQMAGVAVAVTNGEGHTTAIRQPFTTAPVYLFLEDGVPSRSTGFFNHNALYEINIPQAGGIEVQRGPATALYGSDAIGGVVNVLTRTPPRQRELYGSLDLGGHGWRRALVGAGAPTSRGGWRIDLNRSETDGWRAATGYERTSGTLRWDHALDQASLLKVVVGFSDVDQQTGANSPLLLADYRDNPTRNYLPIAFRKVGALRVSAAYDRQIGRGLLSVTPYVRDNSMDLLASFTLNSDPTLALSSNRSYGLLAKWRQDFARGRTQLIGGLDIDVSPGERVENRVLAVPVAGTSGAGRVYTSYTLSPNRIYDYDVTYKGVSPYLHAETSPTERLRLVAGLRYDRVGFELDNRIDAATVTATAPTGASGGTTRIYGQAADTSARFSRLSPKVGLTYAMGRGAHLFASYNEGFRTPSEGQLFRPSSATAAPAAVASARSALALRPIRARQVEVGVRGQAGAVAYEVALYDLEKRDDILSVRDPLTNLTTTTNAGETSHRGLEVSLGLPLARHLVLDIAFSYARHEYVDWRTNQGDFSGREMESAPRVLGNARLTWTPREGTRLQAEWSRLGDYWMDAANTTRYDGHDLVNVRAHVAVHRHLGLFATLYNAADRRYADSASISSATPVYSPGLPRTLNAGAEVRW